MRDLALIGFIVALLALACRRPFLFALAYIYVDTVSPQRLSYHLLNAIPLSMIVAALAMGSWLLLDRKDGLRLTARQGLFLLLIAYAAMTTRVADFPVEALQKWDWAWKAVAFAAFLPLVLRTRLRIEAAVLFLVLSAASIIVVGGIKTVLSGGGYGVLNLMVDNNSGLYESSTISTIAIALIPLVLWLARFGTVFPPGRGAPGVAVKALAAGLVFACLLIPVGTETRTGLVCIALLALLMLRDVKRRLLYIGAIVGLGLVAVPFLPGSFLDRMQTIEGYKADESAGTRLAVWSWTLGYVKEHPFGGGFGAYRQNHIQVRLTSEQTSGDVETVSAETVNDSGRAWHSAYFEMLGEQGWPGLGLFLLLHLIGLARMERLRRRYRAAPADEAWIAPLATALQHFQIVYLVGALFIAIAFQPFVLMVLGVQIGLDTWVGRRERARAGAARPRFGAPAGAPA
jgi:probable O-glycosylation ligase (exosortase A-associated)